MRDDEARFGQDVPAGGFSSWLDDTRRVQRTEGTADVPCDGCTVCCKSSYFIHIGPDESEALAHIPAELLFPAPGRPAGHRVIGYDERGHCPMLVDDQCSIYEHRPKTCRAYDCRVFPATGLTVIGDDKRQLAERATRWRFSQPGDDDLRLRAAVQAAARFMVEHAERFPEGFLPRNPTQLAVLAAEVYDVFVDRQSAEGIGDIEVDGMVAKVVDASRSFNDGKRSR